MTRETCPERDQCTPTGHRRGADGRWQRCPCLERELRRGKLGVFDTPEIPARTELAKRAGESLLIEGPLTAIRPHMARILLDDAAAGRTNAVLDAYRLVEIFIDKDPEYSTIQPLTDANRTTILLGFGDVKNQRLPDLILQVLARRDLLRRPTWVILGVHRDQLPTRYNAELAERLSQLRRVNIR